MEIIHLILGELATNCYLVECGNGEAFAVDIGNGAKKFMKTLQEHHLNLKAILLTHGHYDHVAGAAAVRKMTGEEVYIHEKDALMLESADANLAWQLTDEIFIPVQKYQTVTDGQILRIGDKEIHVLHTPGHTPGGVCYLTEDFMFSGDTLFRGSIGRTDFPHSNPEDMVSSLKKLSVLTKDYHICPGHFNDSTLEMEKVNNPYLRAYI